MSDRAGREALAVQVQAARDADEIIVIVHAPEPSNLKVHYLKPDLSDERVARLLQEARWAIFGANQPPDPAA